jgi:hypothetical protein
VVSTFAERIDAAVHELAAVTATAQKRWSLRQREGRRLSPALRAQLAELSAIAADAGAILADLSYGAEAVNRSEAALAEIEEAARAGGYDLTAYDTMHPSTPLRDHPGGRSRSTNPGNRDRRADSAHAGNRRGADGAQPETDPPHGRRHSVRTDQ